MSTQSRASLSAQSRPADMRKSELKELRRSGQIPGSVFGHGDNMQIQVSEAALLDYLRQHPPGAILDLRLDAGSTPVLVREVNRDPVSGRIIHLSLQRVNLRESVHATIPLVITGEEELVREGLVPEHQMVELHVTAEAGRLPESIPVDVSRLGAGATLRVQDLALPRGVTARQAPDLPVVRVTSPTVAPDVQAALDAEDAAHEALRIAHNQPDEEASEEAEETAEAAA